MNKFHNDYKHSRIIELELKSFFEVTTEINALDYLEQSLKFLLESERNLLAWKWIVISIHGALYGFCISALRGSNPDLVRTKNKKKIIGFPEALKRCRNVTYLKKSGNITDQPLVVTKKQEEAINNIQKKFRDNFEHFPPSSYSIAGLDIAENIAQIFEVIEFLTFKTKTYILRLENEEKERISVLCTTGQQIANSMNLKLNNYLEEYQKLSKSQTQK